MTRLAMICAALFLGAPAGAEVQLQPLPGIEEPPLADEPNTVDTAREQVRDCAGEKFVFAWGAGARPTKVTLCSEPGATTEDIVRMLEDAAAKIEASPIAEDRRIAIAQQMKSKIAELTAKPRRASPVVQPPPPAAAPSVAQAAPKPVPNRASPAPAVVLPAALPKPRLAFECYTPGELGSGGPCTTLGRETRLTVKARDALPAGSNIRFVRNGEVRGELALGQMRKGGATRLTLPREVCSGIVEAETEIQVVRAGQVVDRAGPYLLRC